MDDEIASLLAAGADAPLFTHQRLWLRREVERLEALELHDAPPILVESQREQVQRAVEATRAALHGELLWGPLELWHPPKFHLELPPPSEIASARPQVAIVRDGVLLIESQRLILVGRDTVEIACSAGDLVAVDDSCTRAMFKIGGDLDFVVFDSVDCRPVKGLDGFRTTYAASAVSSALSLVDLGRGQEAQIGGHGLDPVDFDLSPCGRYLWPRVSPSHDELGVIDIERGHPVWSGSRGDAQDSWYDESVRAIARRADGAFVQLRDRALSVDGVPLHVFDETPDCAAFDRTGTRVVLVYGRQPRLFELSELGLPV